MDQQVVRQRAWEAEEVGRQRTSDRPTGSKTERGKQKRVVDRELVIDQQVVRQRAWEAEEVGRQRTSDGPTGSKTESIGSRRGW